MVHRFYCRFQLHPTQDAKWVSGSKVNDGICDCCDGSDEWRNVTLPESVQLADSVRHFGLYQGPCIDRCSETKAEAQQQSIVHQQGAKIKQQYLASLNDQAPVDKVLEPALCILVRLFIRHAHVNCRRRSCFVLSACRCMAKMAPISCCHRNATRGQLTSINIPSVRSGTSNRLMGIKKL